MIYISVQLVQVKANTPTYGHLETDLCERGQRSRKLGLTSLPANPLSQEKRHGERQQDEAHKSSRMSGQQDNTARHSHKYVPD